MIAVGLAIGALLGLLAAPLVARLPRGIPERLEQPGWTRAAGRRSALVTLGAACGALLGAGAPTRFDLALGLILVAALLPAAAIDLAWRVVPDTLIVAGSLAGVAVVALARPDALVVHLAAGLGGGLVALALAVAARGGFGLGDVKVIAMAGLILGTALPLAAVAALGAAGCAALPVLLARGRGATLPLVPFLAAGALIACLAPFRALAGV